MELFEMLKRRTSIDLYADDDAKHYSAGAIWNGDWRCGRLLKGCFGSDIKPRHYAISMGRLSCRHMYANALSFFPMTSHFHKNGICLLKLPAGTMDFLPFDTYVLPIRMLMTEVQLECWAEANYQGELPNELMTVLKGAWAARLRSFKVKEDRR